MAMPVGLSSASLPSQVSSGIRPIKPQQAQQITFPPFSPAQILIRTVNMFHSFTHYDVFCPLNFNTSGTLEMLFVDQCLKKSSQMCKTIIQ